MKFAVLVAVVLCALCVSLGAAEDICYDGKCTPIPSLGEYQGAVLEMCSCKSAKYNEVVNFIGNSYYYHINNLEVKWLKGGEDPVLIMKRAGKKDKRIDIRPWSHADIKKFLFAALGTEKGL